MKTHKYRYFRRCSSPEFTYKYTPSSSDSFDLTAYEELECEEGDDSEEVTILKKVMTVKMKMYEITDSYFDED